MDVLAKWGATGKDLSLAEIMQTGDELAAEIRTSRARVAELEAQLADHKKLLLLAKEALASASTFGGFVNAVAQKAIAAINDSKAVDGLILCDRDLNHQIGDIIAFEPRRADK